MKEETKRYYNATKFSSEDLKEGVEGEIPESWRKIFYKTYPRFPSRKIERKNIGGNMEDLLTKRKTTREFSIEGLTFDEISKIIYWSAGLKEKPNQNFLNRMYPSAGARYPLEVYLTAHNIIDMKKGLYHFNVRDNGLEFIYNQNLDEEMKEIMGVNFFEKSNAVIILTGALSRTEVKYDQNAYRFALIEAGHVGQNIHLISESLDIGCCAIGGFDNDRLSRVLDIGGSEIPLYLFTIGKK